MQEEQKYRTKKRIYVWWHYHWVMLLAGLAFLALLLAVILSQFHRIKPDYQIAVISSEELPVDTQSALVRELTPYCSDQNGDGRVLLQLNSYRADFGDAAVDNDAYDQMSGTIKLYSDISSDNGSYIFLFNDPEGFEETTRLLQYLDGTSPENEEEPVNVWDMCYPWVNCPVLSDLSLGSYRGRTLMDNDTGESQDILSTYYIGRKIITSEKQEANYEKDEALWQTLTRDAVPSEGKK